MLGGCAKFGQGENCLVVTRRKALHEAERVWWGLRDGKEKSEGAMIFREVSDLSQIQQRPGPGLTLQRLHDDAEHADRKKRKGVEFDLQVQSISQLHGQVADTTP